MLRAGSSRRRSGIVCPASRRGGPAMSGLIVEDDPSTCELLTRLLTRQGFEIEVANTLLEGMLRLAGKPCGVLLDLGLPDGDGLDLLKFVRDGQLAIPRRRRDRQHRRGDGRRLTDAPRSRV